MPRGRVKLVAATAIRVWTIGHPASDHRPCMKVSRVGWIVVLCFGCSSSYRPASSPKIAYAMSGGNIVLHKNGYEYPAGLFYGGVEEAVAGNPRAEAEARTARDLAIAGFTLSLAAVGSAVGGLVLLGSNDGESTTRERAGVGLLLGALVVDIAAIIVLANGPPHVYDAVNIYNDGVASGESPPPSWGPPQVVPASPPPPPPAPGSAPSSGAPPAVPSATVPAQTAPGP